ncbi:sulfatase-like hydrolase/transferase [Haloferula sp. A504]|uniref:sulfatase-like hydrolase/transferase n=1 Tax=Haloferula sp. A504 TaxID=3373601 RepID=UPI0031BE234F|nr:sulfatase-like hydrolase/transferase [Verrucomicrobiaceae bacterium E54]
MWLLPVLSFCLLAGPGEAVTQDAAGRGPNVVIIYGDDVGYGDVGVYGATKIPTPRIDALAAQGLRFTDAHCAAATCTPSRYTLLTGEMAFRKPGTGIAHGLANMLIDPGQFTLADLFQQAGYRTAVIGKWHLGLDDEAIDWNGRIEPGPEAIGFDHHFILPATNDRLPCVYVEGGRVVNLDPADPITVRRGRRIPDEVPGTVYPDARLQPEAITAYPGDAAHSGTVINGLGRIGYMRGGMAALFRDEDIADDLVREAGKFIRGHAGGPFFLFFSANDIHAPRWPHPRFRGVSDQGLRGDAMVSFDWSVGAILELLEKEGLASDTLVILTSDNGPVYIDGGYLDGCETKGSGGVDRGHRAAGPFRGGKYKIHEGGTRVPFIVRWPERVRPGVSGALFSQADLLGSLAQLLGRDLPEGAAADSRDLLPTLLGKDPKGAEHILTQTHRTRALRRGSLKYIGGDEPELYDLSKDPGEQDNLIAVRPDLAAELATELSKYAGTGLRGGS